jgi:hypothetical protein
MEVSNRRVAQWPAGSAGQVEMFSDAKTTLKSAGTPPGQLNLNIRVRRLGRDVPLAGKRAKKEALR